MMNSEKPIRVVRLTPHIYFPVDESLGWPVKFDPIGGMQTQIYRQVHDISTKGVDQYIFTLGLPHVAKKVNFKENIEVYSVRLPLLPVKSELRGTPGLNWSWGWGAYLQAKKMRKEYNFDLVHCHCSGVKEPLLFGRWVANVLNIPLVYTIHCSSLYTYHPMNRLDAILLPLTRAIEKKSVKSADHIITLTPRVANKFIEAGLLPGHKISIVPDCIDVDAFNAFVTKESQEDFLNQYNIPKDKKKVLYCGRVAIEKGWPYFVEMARLLKDEGYHFIVSGDGNQGYKLRERVKELNLSDYFTITGFISQQKVAQAISLADVLVLPSMHEEFGSVCLEAMALKCPIIAFKIGGITSVIQDGENGILVTPQSASEIANAVRKITSDKKLKQAIVEHGFEGVRNKYSTDSVTDKILAVYKRVLEERK